LTEVAKEAVSGFESPRVWLPAKGPPTPAVKVYAARTVAAKQPPILQIAAASAGAAMNFPRIGSALRDASSQGEPGMVGFEDLQVPDLAPVMPDMLTIIIAFFQTSLSWTSVQLRDVMAVPFVRAEAVGFRVNLDV
jgi:hypothetical protein